MKSTSAPTTNLTKQKKESIYLNRLLEGIKLDDKKRSDKE
jgi:hypothetical protein